jgi:hypothetical protein
MIAGTGCVAHIKQALAISSGDTSSISMTVPVSWIWITHPDLQVVRRIKQGVPLGALAAASPPAGKSCMPSLCLLSIDVIIIIRERGEGFTVQHGYAPLFPVLVLLCL